MKAGRRATSLSILVLVLLLPVHGEGYLVEQLLFLPPQFYVGDPVELRLRIDSGGVELPAEPAGTPEADWLVIHEIRVIPIAGKYDVRIRFTTYRPGTLVIPGFSLGSLEIDPIPVETTSIRGSDGVELQRILDPMLLPGTGLLIALVAGVVLFGPLLALLGIGWLRRAVMSFAVGVRRPYRKLRRELERLGSEAAAIGAREFYARLFDAFRSYLAERSEYNYLAATTREMSDRLREEFRGIEPVESFSEIAGEVDRAKFGGGEASPAERHDRLELVRESAEMIEERRRTGVVS